MFLYMSMILSLLQVILHTETSSLVSTLHHQFSLKDLGLLRYFLCIEVSRPKSGGIFLYETKYIIDLLHEAQMFEANSITTCIVRLLLCLIFNEKVLLMFLSTKVLLGHFNM